MTESLDPFTILSHHPTVLCCFIFFGHTCGMPDLGSLTRDQTHDPCRRSAESWLVDLDHQGSPVLLFSNAYTSLWDIADTQTKQIQIPNPGVETVRLVGWQKARCRQITTWETLQIFTRNLFVDLVFLMSVWDLLCHLLGLWPWANYSFWNWVSLPMKWGL